MRPARELSLYVWVSIIFILSQLFAFLLGIRFAGSLRIIIEPFWQYLDPQILKTDLLRGLYYLHSQPPLFNWLLGIVLQLFPNHTEFVFSLILRVIGLGTLLLMALIMRCLSIRTGLIIGICSIFAVFPNFLVYTNLLFYTLPIAFLLLLSCFFLQKFSQTQSASYAHLFTWIAALIMLTRSIYHVGWFVISIAVLFLLMRLPNRRILLRASILPVLIVILFYAKNGMLVGSAGPSSWLGMNLARGWVLPNEAMRKFNAFLEPSEIQHLVQSKKVNAEWLAGPFNPPAAYKHLGYFSTQRYIHPAISAPEKQSGFPNFNHADYARISQKMLETDRAIINEYPKMYLARVWLNFQLFLQPATGPSWFLVQSYDYTNVERYRRWMTLLLFQGRMIELAQGRIPWNSLYILFPVLILFGIKKGMSVDDNRFIYGYITLTILWVAVVTNLIEFGENNRIRFETDPLIAILFAAAIQTFLKPQGRKATPSETS